MTNRVRKGNDVRIRWRVDRLGEPVNLEEGSIKVELIDRFRRSVPVTFSVEGNVVIIDFAAANQKTNGEHTAVLIVSDGYTTNTVDKCNIIDLVEHSCEECCLDVDAEGRVWIDAASNLVFPANGKDGIGIDSIIQTETSMESEGVNKIEITLSNGEKVCFEVRNGRRGSPGYTPRKGVDYSDGKSLYELLVDAGLFEGTLDDFLVRFENARTANETATERADEAAGNAETAAKEATAAAETAGSAAIAANTAKDNADTATTNAIEAAQSANDAADRANAAAEAVEPYENRLENVEGKVTELDFELNGDDVISIEWLGNGTAISMDGSINSYVYGRRSKPIFIKKGTSVNIEGTYPIYISMLAYDNGDGTYATILNVTQTNTGIKQSWIASKDCYVVLSYVATTSIPIALFNYDGIEDRVATIEDIHIAKIESAIWGTIKKHGKNLLDESKLVSGYLKSDGTIASNANYAVSDYIDVEGVANLVLSVTRENGTRAAATQFFSAFFDVNKNILVSSYQSMPSSPRVVPSGAVYYRVSVQTDQGLTQFQLEDGINHTAYEPYIGEETINRIEKLWGARWDNKKWCVVGDSLTEHNNKATKNYHDYIAEETGISVVNRGISGTGYARTAPFYQRISSIPSDVDVITIFGSGNDSGAGLEIGNATDTALTTLCGYVNKCIDEVQTRFPLVPFGIITPCPWQGSEPNENGGNSWMSRYAAALVDVCKLRGVPCLDLYHCSNLHPSNAAFRSLVYTNDGDLALHPNEIGHKIIAPRFKAFLETLVE